MTKVLMVCLGNICRSPLAEGILREKAKKAGLLNLTVDSAGTAPFHIGEHPDKRSIANALKHGVDISAHIGRQFGKADFAAFDRIYVMDHSNLENVLTLTQDNKERSKVKLILNELHPGMDQPVPDPYFGGEEGFEAVFQLLDNACAVIVKQLTE